MSDSEKIILRILNHKQSNRQRWNGVPIDVMHLTGILKINAAAWQRAEELGSEVDSTNRPTARAEARAEARARARARAEQIDVGRCVNVFNTYHVPAFAGNRVMLGLTALLRSSHERGQWKLSSGTIIITSTRIITAIKARAQSLSDSIFNEETAARMNLKSVNVVTNRLSETPPLPLLNQLSGQGLVACEVTMRALDTAESSVIADRLAELIPRVHQPIFDVIQSINLPLLLGLFYDMYSLE